MLRDADVDTTTSELPAPPIAASPKSPWAALGAVIVCYGFNSADRQLPAILQEPMAQDLHLSDSALGSLGLFFAIAYGLASFPLSVWSDRGWARQVISATLAGWSLMTIACGAATSLQTLGLGRAGMALGEAGSAPAAQSLVARRFPPHLRATAMGLLLAGAIIGTALSAGIGGWIAHALGWRAAFFSFGAAGVVATPFVWFFLGAEVEAHVTSKAAQRGELVRVARAYWAQKSLRFLCVASATASVGSSGAAHWIGSLLIREYGLSVADAGVSLLAAMLVGGAAGATLGGFAADSWGKRDSRAYAGVPAFAMLLGVGAMLAIATASNAIVAALGFGLIAFAANGMLAPIYALVQRLAPKDARATAAAFIMLMMNLVGMALGPLLFGLASDLTKRLGGADSLKTAILLGAAAFLIGAVAALRATFSVSADLAAHEG